MQFKSLDSFRGLAAIVVVLYHSGFVVTSKSQFVANSAIFVDFFFILSGFVMAFAYLKRIQAGISFRQFVLLRIGRLYPLHLFTLLIWLLYVLLKGYAYHIIGLGSVDPFQRDNPYTFVTNLLLINGLGLHDYLSWNHPAWSISVEFYTYILYFLAIVTFTIKSERWFFGASSLFAYALLYFVSDSSLLNVTNFGILRCVGGFSLGVCLYSLYKRNDSFSLENYPDYTPSFPPARESTLATHSQFQPTKIVATLLEASSVATMIYLVSVGGHQKKLQLLVFGVFALVIFIFAIQSNGLLSDLLTRPIFLWLGTLSYSIYMVHLLILDIAGNIWKYVLRVEITRIPRIGVEPLELFTTPFAPFINVGVIMIIVAVSHFTYRFVEIPCRDWVRSWIDDRRHRPSSH